MTNPANDYLIAAFRAYFADAGDITVDFDGDERILVHVLRPTNVADNFRLVSWECVIGSDDDRYLFVRAPYLAWDGDVNRVLTVPLMPEA